MVAPRVSSSLLILLHCVVAVVGPAPPPPASCAAAVCDTTFSSGYSEKVYTASDASLINPERGGARLLISKASSPVPLTVSGLDNYRSTDYINIIWRQWYLDTFFTASISESFLTHIQSDFDALRSTGFKATIRFAYTEDQNAAMTEPEKDQLLAHIAQLKPLFQANEDVILSVQMGFIGAWGEWYYTTHFGNAGVLTEADEENRRDVVSALMAAVPSSRSFHIRTLAQKRYITGESSALTSSEYRNPANNSSRIGHHNDCFLASSTDFGTYGDVAVDYPYLNEDTKYVPMGGETCILNSPRSDCPTAEEELEKFHWTFLNLAYNVMVLNEWKAQGCFDGILKRLGHRLRLTRAFLPNKARSGKDVCFRIDFINDGYAAPINPREVRLVFRSLDGRHVYTSHHIPEFTQAEPWLPESGEISVLFGINLLNMAAGNYQVLLWFKDPLLSDPEHNILLANQNVPEVSYGLNNLNHVIKIKPAGTSTQTPFCSPLDPTSPMFSYSKRLRCFENCDGLESENSRLPDQTSFCTNNLLVNPNFKNGTEGYEKTHRIQITSEYFFDTSTAPVRDPDDDKAVKMFCSETRKGGKWYQYVRFDPSENVRELTVSLWSYVDTDELTPPEIRGDYALFMHITKEDGTKKNERVLFDARVGGWQRRQLRLTVGKNIVKVRVGARCRRTSGPVYFDEMGLFAAPAKCIPAN